MFLITVNQLTALARRCYCTTVHSFTELNKRRVIVSFRQWRIHLGIRIPDELFPIINAILIMCERSCLALRSLRMRLNFPCVFLREALYLLCPGWS